MPRFGDTSWAMDDNTAAGSPETVTQKTIAGHELNEFAWSVLDGLPTAIVVCEATDAGLQVIYHNPCFSELIHIPDDVVAGANLVSLLEDGLDPEALAALKTPSDQLSVDVEIAPGSSTTLRLAPHTTVSNYWIASFEPHAVLNEPTRSVLESMINASHNLVVAKDLEGRYLSVNSAFAEFTGQPKEVILGLSWTQLNALRSGLPSPPAPSLSPAEEQVVRSARPAVERGVRILNANNRERVMDVTRTPVLDQNRQVKFLISVASDSTESDYWSQRYEVQTELLAQLMDAIPDPIWVCDATGALVRSNIAFKNLAGDPPRQDDFGLGFVSDQRRVREMLACDQRVISHNTEELIKDVPVREGKQQRWLDVWKVPLNIPVDDSRCVVSVGRDITQRYHAESAQRERLRSTRLVAKISSLFVSQPPERTDDQLIAALGEVAEYAGAFRCIVRELPHPDGSHQRVLEWRADGIMGGQEDTEPWKLSWLMAELEKSGYVLCPSIGQLPAAATEEAEICRREGINAFIAAPLKLHGHIRGILFVNCLRSDPPWTDNTAESIAVCADILAAAIDRADTQHRLNLASDHLREIATSIPGAIFQWEITKNQNHLNYVSEGIAVLTELDYTAVVEDPSKVLDLVDADSRRAAMRRTLLAAERLETFQMEVPVNLPRSGNRRWVKLSVSARQADSGSVLLDGLISDVTDVKQHEQALLAARNQLEGVTRSIPGMVYQARYTAQSTTPALLFASRGTKDVFGVDAQQIMRDPSLLTRMVLVEDLPGVRSSLQRAITDLTPWNHEFRIRDAAGRLKWIQAHAVPTGPDSRGGVQFNGMLMDVTDRQRTVRRLRDAEDELRDLTASMPGFVFRMDVFDHGHTRLSYVSEGVREIYAMTAEEVMAASNKTLAEMVVEEDRAIMDQAVSDALRTGTTVTLERRLVDAVGNEHWLQTLLRPQPSLDGAVSLVGVTLDVTERKQAELALAVAEQRVREVTQALPGVVFQFHCSPTGELSWRYMAGRTITGRPTGDLVDDFSLVEDQVHEDDRQRLRAAIGQAAKNLTPIEADFRVPMPDGELRWARMSADPTRIADGGALFNGFAIDITRRKQAEEALLVSEERYRAVVQDQSEIVCRLDADGCVLFINQAGSRQFGPNEQCLHKPWWELLPRISREVAQTKLMALTAISPSDSIELRTDTGEAEPVWHQWDLRAFATPEGVLKGYQAVGRDVTEVKGLERQVRGIADREQQRIGHDLHDGLGQDLTGLSLLLKGLEHGALSQAPELLADVKNAQEVLNESIATTRALAQGLSPVHLERDGLAGALEQLATNVEARHHVPIVVRHRGSRDVGVTIVTEFYRIAQEAVNNAARHANATKIDIDLDLKTGMRLTVRDDGQGIQGTTNDGMGLRIMQYRADLLGAQLSVQQGAKRGTVVICELTEQALEGNA